MSESLRGQLIAKLPSEDELYNFTSKNLSVQSDGYGSGGSYVNVGEFSRSLRNGYIGVIDHILCRVVKAVEGMPSAENPHRYHEYNSNYGEDEYMRLDNARHIAYENGTEDTVAAIVRLLKEG